MYVGGKYLQHCARQMQLYRHGNMKPLRQTYNKIVRKHREYK